MGWSLRGVEFRVGLREVWGFGFRDYFSMENTASRKEVAAGRFAEDPRDKVLGLGFTGPMA